MNGWYNLYTSITKLINHIMYKIQVWVLLILNCVLVYKLFLNFTSDLIEKENSTNKFITFYYSDKESQGIANNLRKYNVSIVNINEH